MDNPIKSGIEILRSRSSLADVVVGMKKKNDHPEPVNA